MSLEINGNRQAGTAAGAPQQKKEPKVLGKIAPGESLFKVRNTDRRTGKLESVEYYKDFNGDGVITENELSHVDRYVRHEDGSKEVIRHKDKDNDGYSDTQTTYKYDKDGNLVDKKTVVEEDINSVKKREHMDHEVINRQMLNHKLGMYIQGSVSYPENKNEAPSENNFKVKESKITEYDNIARVYTDSDGNTVIRVDYGNDDPEEFFEEEEVRTPDGKLVSYTEVSYSDLDGEKKGIRYFDKHVFDKNGNEIEIITTKYEHGKLVSTTREKPKEGMSLVGHVHTGIPVDGFWGDPELQKFVQEHGGSIVGRQ